MIRTLVLFLFGLTFAFAAERRQLEIKGVGLVTVKIVDTQGEPIGADQLISITLKCAGGKTKSIERGLQTCAYDGIKYDEATRKIELSYRLSQMGNNGRLSCVDRQMDSYDIVCP